VQDQIVQQAQESMVLNPSDASSSSMNMVHQAALAWNIMISIWVLRQWLISSI
jgi:hypothetical protein